MPKAQKTLEALNLILKVVALNETHIRPFNIKRIINSLNTLSLVMVELVYKERKKRHLVDE